MYGNQHIVYIMETTTRRTLEIIENSEIRNLLNKIKLLELEIN